MAKEIIDAIKEAETKGLLAKEDAKKAAEKLVKDAKEKAESIAAEEIKKYSEMAEKSLNEAKEQAASLLKEAEENAAAEKAALKDSTKGVQTEVVKEIISKLFS